ncbi:MAG: hypothetical protein ACJAS1_007164 [Oleiphilaceae bacterium]|jgi:hypothetical protein
MKPEQFRTDCYNPIVEEDVKSYRKDVGERIGSVKPRSYMHHRNQNGYTRIRQTKTLIIVEWME